ncbi:aryl sulfotransferase [Constrictibacter sp. MBR-5]|jgi:aryl sulfotransferase|uniref:sulfotransferase domain-containing protein n=1 Tax=Constrictibacter sp. MBR-5 TaxID=3156467 RepID=UPI00339312CC
MTGFVWIASYPRSGNTWLRLALGALLDPGQAHAGDAHARFAPNASQRSDIEEALDVETGDLTPAEMEALRPVAYRTLAALSRRPLFRKVHDACIDAVAGTPLFPPDATLATLYMVRDPRDVAVSWAHFAGIGLEEAVRFLCDAGATLRPAAGRPPLDLPQRLLCWSGHVRSWLDAPGRRCCLLRYEDMVADPAAILGRAAAHAGIAATAETLDRAVAATRFDALRAHEARQGFDGGQSPGSAFFRSGRAGGWRTALPPDLEARIVAAHGPAMEALGYLAEAGERPCWLTAAAVGK